MPLGFQISGDFKYILDFWVYKCPTMNDLTRRIPYMAKSEKSPCRALFIVVYRNAFGFSTLHKVVEASLVIVEDGIESVTL